MTEEFNWVGDKKERNRLILELSENYTQSQICNLIKPKVSQATISNILNGKSILKEYKHIVTSHSVNSNSNCNYSDVDTIFDDISTYASMVISNIKKGLLITGMSGMGKTHTVTQELKKHNKIKNIDYVFIKGKITPLGLYITLYTNRNRLIIFDDSDSVWDNDDCVNFLKHALDNCEDRTINWTSSKEIKNPLFNSNDDFSDEIEKIPNNFEFNGSIIFISNKYKHELDTAVLTRTLKVDLNLSLDDTLKRIEYLMPTMHKEISNENKIDALDFMKKISKSNDRERIDISIRSYNDILDMKLYGGDNWERLALQQCLR